MVLQGVVKRGRDCSRRIKRCGSGRKPGEGKMPPAFRVSRSAMFSKFPDYRGEGLSSLLTLRNSLGRPTDGQVRV